MGPHPRGSGPLMQALDFMEEIMKKSDKSFLEYALSRSGESHTRWLKGIAQQYSEKITCPLCNSETVDIVIAPKVIIRCDACHTRSEIDINKIQLGQYNVVTFLHEETIKAILEERELTKLKSSSIITKK